MDKFYCFCLGISLGLLASFFMFGKFWWGMLAGIPVGALLLAVFVLLIAILAGAVDDNHDPHFWEREK